MTRVVPLMLVALLAVSGVAAAESGAVTLGPIFDRDVVLQLHLQAGETVTYEWNASASVELVIDRINPDITMHEHQGLVGSGSFTAPTEGDYVFEFRNLNFEAAYVNWNISRSLDSSLLLLAILAIIVAVVVIAGLAQRSRRRGMPPTPPPPPMR